MGSREHTQIIHEVNIIPHLFARFYFWITGWKINGPPPPEPKIVAIAAPHTTNYDGFLINLVGWYARRKLHYMIKIEWTRGPMGWILRQLGAMGIDRSTSFNTVEQVTQMFDQSDQLVVAIPPEGTRRKTDHWRTGFYWIAHNAHVPILPCTVDYLKKEITINNPLFYTTGDIAADMEVLWSYYRDITGRYPERASELRLRPSALRPTEKQHTKE